MRIKFNPDSTEQGFEPIVLENLDDGEPAIVAELVEVLADDRTDSERTT